MKVTVFHMGSLVNESEKRCVKHLIDRIESEHGSYEWTLFTKLKLQINAKLQADEVDAVLIGPPGVQLLEFKHWSADWIESNHDIVANEVRQLQHNSLLMMRLLRKNIQIPPSVNLSIILTKEQSKPPQYPESPGPNVKFHLLSSWYAPNEYNLHMDLEAIKQISSMLKALQPAIIKSNGLERIVGYVDLVPLSSESGFHRIYQGVHCSRRDHTIIHLFDFSATNEKKPESIAQKMYNTYLKIQKRPWAPRILDPLQDAPGYSGEVLFFTLKDPYAPTLELRTKDTNWNTQCRLRFACELLTGIEELKYQEDFNFLLEPTQQNIRVKFNDTPIFSDLFLPATTSKENQSFASDLPSGNSILSVSENASSWDSSLGACLLSLFENPNNTIFIKAKASIRDHLGNHLSLPDGLESLRNRLKDLMEKEDMPHDNSSIRYWSEDQIVPIGDKNYRLLFRLNQDEHISNFKAAELGAGVISASIDEECGKRLLLSHRTIKSYQNGSPYLAPLEAVSEEWGDTSGLSSRKWIDGAPLSEFAGMLPLLADSRQESSCEELALHWLEVICTALDHFHKNEWVHGNIAPRNIVLSNGEPIIINYDEVRRTYEQYATIQRNPYYPPAHLAGKWITPSDDIHALANCFLFLLFGKDPISKYDRDQWNWREELRHDYPTLAIFLEKAIQPVSSNRFVSAGEVLHFLSSVSQSNEMHVDSRTFRSLMEESLNHSLAEANALPPILPNRIPWLLSLLKSYPGSKWGNSETRGLDTEFAENTYVPTELEETLYQDILDKKIRLLILCGNAGDGKTALLQHLSSRLGLEKRLSASRLTEAHMNNGAILRINFDGSAAWQGRSADEIMNEFMKPFLDGLPKKDIIHLLAINDGRLLEWLNQAESEFDGSKPLLEEISAHLQQEEIPDESHLRFITLNQRSLVGGLDRDNQRITTDFLNRLIDSLYGGDQAAEIWNPCLNCPAKERCDVNQTALIFGNHIFPEMADQKIRTRARAQLYETLQAVHLRGETHITVRELRATLVYILFGLHYCDDIINNTVESVPYWERAFNADSPQRQGETLQEFVRFDPALDSSPQIDRYLSCRSNIEETEIPPHYAELPLGSARRRAYFEWTEEDINHIGGGMDALGLFGGEYLSRFRDLPLASDTERTEHIRHLCQGVSRLEDLPAQAYNRKNAVPLRVPQRTPTETFFWIEKPLDSFRLEADLPPTSPGLERLHRRVNLVYQYRNGGREILSLGADLFNLLLEIADGYQLGDISQEDIFSRLSIFVQRLVREDERAIFAWHPTEEDMVFRAYVSNKKEKQVLTLEKSHKGGPYENR